MEAPFTPLREAGERVSIEMVGGKILTATGSEKHGPASAVIPLRTSTAEWQIMAWDGITTTTSHDPATLAVATTLAILLVAAGSALFFQQKRALRLASDRVSFVNRVSHELGSPLTNLSLNLDLATELLPSRPQDARDRLGIVGEEIARLSRLVANVLTFSHQERGTLQLRSVRCIPADVVGRTLRNFRPALERRGIEVESEIGGTDPVSLDPDALGQIVGNLLSNVEKYASPGRWLGISCHLENETLEVVVRDRGPGIGPAHRERVFDAFERYCNATNEGSSGTGLGLTIARDLAMKMGGTLELMDDAGGAAFRLEVPAPPVLSLVSEDHPAA
jgi:signal transduction histidine kinase